MRSVLIFFLVMISATAQTTSDEFTYDEFIGYVKKYHPLVKSAHLKISAAQAGPMLARGGFDPKIEVDFEQKKFKDKDYYSVLNSSFKVPTWYGIEVKAGFDNNEGMYLNPQNTVPNQGLTSLGISVPLGQGLFINQRMADLRKAKAQIRLSQAERDLQCIEVVYAASLAYFNWKRAYGETELYNRYLSNAELRYRGIAAMIQQGDKPAIDSIEAGIVLRNRMLGLEESKLKLAKAKLELASFLWLDNNIPMELQDRLIPEKDLASTIARTLMSGNYASAEPQLQKHPKINALQRKIELLDIDRRLKANMLLPKVDVGYSYLSEPTYFDNYRLRDYKIGVNFYFPVFLRKERGSLKLAKFKLQDTQLELDFEQLQLKNKIKAQQTELTSLEKQRVLIERLVKDNETMLRSEDRLFSYGESSVFLINSRENNLVSSQLSQLATEYRYLESGAALMRILGIL